VLAEAAAPREERKVVTVLFADLVGFTSRAERLDPEDVRRILSGYHERVRHELERYGGTVEKFIGDAVMALFGAPTAREDDPERAVRAAIAVREAIADLNEQDTARDLHVRIGVTTGEVLVRLDARPEEGEGMAAGDVVNTAARLQAAAPTDGILVDGATQRATDRAIEYRPTDAVDAKGKAEPVAAFEALQARSRYGVDVRQIGRTPLVGRDADLEVLTTALARARARREPQLVTLAGVPGIGKSRLVYELFRSLQADPDLITWRQGRSLPYGEGVSYWALAEIVKAQAGILDTDGEEVAAAKLTEVVTEIVDDERDAAWVERNLRPLIGLAGESELSADRRAEAFSAWRRFLEALAEKRPLVLVFEDLHFADDGLLDFVDYLLDWVSGVPLLVIGTSRPELLARRPGWGGGKPHALTHSLAPLSKVETAQVVHALLDKVVLPVELQQQLVERAEGNPLYAEEFARLVEEGRQPEELPETVQGIVGARLDSLAVEEKQRLQDAAVLGKVFWLGAVAKLGGGERWQLEELLHSLERKEFVRRERRASVAGESEYAFRHLLVRDVAYGQIPRAVRAEKHRLAAEWIEGMGRPEDHAEMLAHHYLSALELGRAAGIDVTALAERAHRALREAGDRAFALYAYPSAARFYGEAVALALEPDPRLVFRRAESLYRSGAEGSLTALDEASEVLLAAGLTGPAAEVAALLAEAWWLRAERDRCFEHLARAEELVRDAPPSAAKARVLSQVARYRALAEETVKAIEAGQEALAIAERLGLVELQAHALNNIAIARVVDGDIAGGTADIERSIELALSVNSPEAARGYNNLAAFMRDAGQTLRGQDLVDEAIRVADRLGNSVQSTFSRGVVSGSRFLTGRWDEAGKVADDFIADRERDPHYTEVYARWWRALLRLARDDSTGAVDDAQRAVEIARRAKDLQVTLPALGVNLRVAVELGRRDAARSAGAELVDALRPLEAVGRVPFLLDACWAAEGSELAPELHRVIDPLGPDHFWAVTATAVLDGHFAEVADRFAAIGEVANEGYARLRAAEQLVAEGQPAKADEQLQCALAFYRSVGATRYIRQGEELLAALPGE
jgi:class 3 adenylate cyclase